MKKLFRNLLCLAIVLVSFQTVCFAKVGDVIGIAQHTSIVAYINNHAIPSYAVNGQSCIVAEDLANYGFDVRWDGRAMALYITQSSNYYVKEIKFSKTEESGSKFADILETEVKVYANNKRVTAYAINGYTMIPMEELTMFGSVQWLPDEAALKMWVESVSLNKSTLSMTVGDTETLTATILPNNTTVDNVVWKSSNTNVATVDKGIIKAVGEGSAVITATIANRNTSQCKISVEKKPMINTTVYEDSKVKIDFLRVEKYKYDDNEVKVYFDAKNKTNETITIQCDALSLNGYCFNYTIMSDDVSAGCIGTIDTTLKKFDFDLVNISNITTVGGQFRIISDTKSFKTYDALFTNVDVYNGGNIKKYPLIDDRELLYSDGKINMYFDYAENDDEDFEVYLTVQNKTNETIKIQNDTVIINGRSYNKTIMSDPILPYTTGNVNVTISDTNISGNVSTVGGQFRIISDTNSFKTYDAVLGKKANVSNDYEDDDNKDYDDDDYSKDDSKIEVIDRSKAYNKLKTQLMLKGDKFSGGYCITSLGMGDKDDPLVTLMYDSDNKYIVYSINSFGEKSNHVAMLYLYENQAPEVMYIITGDIYADFSGKYNNSEISVSSSTYPNLNASFIKTINATYRVFDELAKEYGIDMKISDFEIDY